MAVLGVLVFHKHTLFISEWSLYDFLLLIGLTDQGRFD